MIRSPSIVKVLFYRRINRNINSIINDGYYNLRSIKNTSKKYNQYRTNTIFKEGMSKFIKIGFKIKRAYNRKQLAMAIAGWESYNPDIDKEETLDRINKSSAGIDGWAQWGYNNPLIDI